MSNRVAHNPYEAHKATDIPEAVIRHYIKTGELPAVRIRRSLVIRREALDAWLKSYERTLTVETEYER
jgi:excisionase family DNA binding protein